MGEDFLYTTFDDLWRPSDALEDAFSSIEGSAAITFRTLATAGAALTVDGRDSIAHFLALTICRHPDVMGRGRRRGVESGYLIADIHSYPDFDSFNEAFRAKFRANLPQETYQSLKAKTPEQLLEEAQVLEGLSPQDPQLPIQDSVRAVPLVCKCIVTMDMTLLDAPPGASFVLGDTPLPDYELGNGFTVPLSSILALKVASARNPAVPSSFRRVALAAEISAINQTQFDNAKRIVIGADHAVLAALA